MYNKAAVVHTTFLLHLLAITSWYSTAMYQTTVYCKLHHLTSASDDVRQHE